MTITAGGTEFARKSYRVDGAEKVVLTNGSTGPAVIVVHEVYGFTETHARLCRWIAEAGFRVFSPILFGRPDASNPEKQSLARIAGLCVSREITLFAQHRSSPVVDWLRGLARTVHGECGGAGVGVVGMCLTGGFALSMAVEPAVLCPVMAQPGLPATKPAAIDISRTELDAVRARVRDEGLEVRGYRFAGDTICRAARFETLASELGPGFAATTLPDAAGNPASPMAQAGKPPHSVFTGDLIDAPGEPTRAAVDEIIGFFRSRLL